MHDVYLIKEMYTLPSFCHYVLFLLVQIEPTVKSSKFPIPFNDMR